MEPMDYRKELIVEPGRKMRLKDIDPAYHGKHEGREQAQPQIEGYLQRMEKFQELLYAERKHALLIVLQGIDAAGKDGVCWHVVKGMNPQGCSVTGFKQPSSEELAHDFLWRVHQRTPAPSALSAASTARTTRNGWSCASTSSSPRRYGSNATISSTSSSGCSCWPTRRSSSSFSTSRRTSSWNASSSGSTILLAIGRSAMPTTRNANCGTTTPWPTRTCSRNAQPSTRPGT